MKSLLAATAVIVLIAGAAGPSQAQERTGNAAVTGAGSTFAFPIVSRWARGYARWVAGGGDFATAGGGLDDPPTRALLDYEPSGSLAGTMRVNAGAVDFGASDVPIRSDELKKLGLAQFPIVIGGVAIVTNLEGIGPARLKLSGAVLADIFLGKIAQWSDPAIQALNPGLKLPEERIAVIHRADGSGTTYNFANYLSKVSPAWREAVGFDLLVRWPVGTGTRGNDGMARTLRQTRNAIGYIEFARAVEAGLPYALLQNAAGDFIEPKPPAFQVAAAGAPWQGAGDFDLLLTDVQRKDAYPIVATVFVLMRKDAPAARSGSTLNFFLWALERGAAAAAAIGYVPLPPDLVGQVKAYWKANLTVP